jgi:hypothetical protein
MLFKNIYPTGTVKFFKLVSKHMGILFYTHIDFLWNIYSMWLTNRYEMSRVY